MFEVLESRRMLAYSYSLSGGVMSITLEGDNDIITGTISGSNLIVTVKEGALSAVTVYNAASAAVSSFAFVLGNGNDTVDLNTCPQPATIQGGNGNDTIDGGNGNDTIRGNAGTDDIHGMGGNDLLDGGANNDVMNGGSGLDTVDYTGRTGNVTADLLNNSGDGEAGENDTIGSDCDSLMGGSGNDVLTGNTNANYLFGGLGNDTLAGGMGNDILCGGAGQDAMFGNEGNDSFFARDGEIDTIDGGAGTDAAQADPA